MGLCFSFGWEGWEELNWSGNEQLFTDPCQEGKGANFTVGLEHLATISRWAMESTAQRAKLSFRVQQRMLRCQAATWPEGAPHPRGALGTPSSPAWTLTSWQAPPRGLRPTAAERPAGLCHFTPLGFTYTLLWRIANMQKQTRQCDVRSPPARHLGWSASPALLTTHGIPLRQIPVVILSVGTSVHLLNIRPLSLSLKTLLMLSGT